MIKSFQDKDTERVFHQEFTKRIPRDIARIGLRKLIMIDVAESLLDLKAPPANHLEPLKGDLFGKWSIRINNQWRIVFIPRVGGKEYEDVQIVDYHD